MLKSEVRMDDINSMVSSMVDDVIHNKVSDIYDDEDSLFDKLRNALEEFFNYPDYRNYN